MISMRNLSLKYAPPASDPGSGSSLPPIFRQIDFDLPRGGFRYITGPSGAGKTSFLKLIYLAQKPTGGSLSLFGQDAVACSADDKAALRRRIGVVFQDFRLVDHLTVLENVALPLIVQASGALQQSLADKDRRRIIDLLTWVGLGDHMHRYPPTLSGGQKQRVALARAVIARPWLLLADEPTGNLDDGIGMRLMYLLQELNRIGTTVLVATHSQQLIRYFPGEVSEIKGSKIITSASPVAGRQSSSAGASPIPGGLF